MAHGTTEPGLPFPSRTLLAVRLGIGIVQGLALYAMSWLVDGDGLHLWAAANPKSFGLPVLVATLLPPAILLGLGHLRGPVLAVWALVAAGLILLLGSHDLGQHGEATMTPASNGLLASLGAMLFMGQALVAAADAGRRWWPRYADLFETAWRGGLQLALAGCFVLGFWLIYWIGSELFEAIGIDALNRLGGRTGFALPVTTVLGAVGIHLADVGWRLTLGLRSLLLGLKAWLTPVLTGLAAAFILALPFTGLEVLQGRQDVPGWLIAAAMGLVALISAVHGDGRETPPAALRLSARLASFTLPVLLALAGWVLVRQVDEQGLTEGRVVGLAALAVLSVHAVGYPIAATRPGMRLLEPANMVAALVALPVLAALNLPIGDPARLEVRSQTARLLRGAVLPDNFDFHRLRRFGRDGERALADLTGHPDPEIARRARQAARSSDEGGFDGAARADAGDEPVAPRLRAVPGSAILPTGLVEAMREASPECVAEECLARAFPPVGNNAWLVGPIFGRFWVMRPEGTGWRRVAIYDAPYGCDGPARGGLLEGDAQAVPPPLPDLSLAGLLFRPVLLREECG